MFSPEFRNRLDSIISFDFLSPTIMINIVEKAISYLEGQLSEKNITIELTEEAKLYLSKKGFDKRMEPDLAKINSKRNKGAIS